MCRSFWGRLRRRRARLVLGLTGVVLLLSSVVGPSASVQAAFAGTNGKIAFTSQRDGNPEIYVMNADGSGQTRLTNNPRGDEFPAWSPDGTKIAFASVSDRGDSDSGVRLS